eukprot:1157608-Pelagomonas_calceolata.AAC.5
MSVRAVVAAAPAAAAGQCFPLFLLRPSGAMPAASTHICPQLILNISGLPKPIWAGPSGQPKFIFLFPGAARDEQHCRSTNDASPSQQWAFSSPSQQSLNRDEALSDHEEKKHTTLKIEASGVPDAGSLLSCEQLAKCREHGFVQASPENSRNLLKIANQGTASAQMLSALANQLPWPTAFYAAANAPEALFTSMTHAA